MRVNLDNPTPGSFTDQVFDLVIEGTRIGSPTVQAALRAHFVQGLDRKVAYESNGVDPGAFSVRCKRFLKEVDRLREVIALCAPKPAPEALTAALLDTKAQVQELQTKVGAALDMTKGGDQA